jgi:5S rRNA maturation endonuclease (ribonuclease M5)
MMMTKTDLRKEAAKRMPYILDKLGVRYSRRGDMLQARCPCKQHEGDRDNPTAFSWRLDLGRWTCWTHHCQEVFGNDSLGIIWSILDKSFDEVCVWTEKILSDPEAAQAVDVTHLRKRRSRGELHRHRHVSENVLRFINAGTPPQYMLDQGYTSEVLKRYEVGYWERPGTFMHERVVFPVRDVDKNLVGFTARTIHEDYKQREIEKWLHARRFDRFPRRDELQTGSLIYNLYSAKDFLGPEKAFILVEGPKDVLRLEQAGIHNSGATLGVAFGPGHRTLLVQLGVNVLYRGYDPDKAGQKANVRMEDIVGNMIEIRDIEFKNSNDPGSMSNEEILETFPCTSTL